MKKRLIPRLIASFAFIMFGISFLFIYLGVTTNKIFVIVGITCGFCIIFLFILSGVLGDKWKTNEKEFIISNWILIWILIIVPQVIVGLIFVFIFDFYIFLILIIGFGVMDLTYFIIKKQKKSC